MDRQIAYISAADVKKILDPRSEVMSNHYAAWRVSYSNDISGRASVFTVGVLEANDGSCVKPFLGTEDEAVKRHGVCFVHRTYDNTSLVPSLHLILSAEKCGLDLIVDQNVMKLTIDIHARKQGSQLDRTPLRIYSRHIEYVRVSLDCHRVPVQLITTSKHFGNEIDRLIPGRCITGEEFDNMLKAIRLLGVFYLSRRERLTGLSA